MAYLWTTDAFYTILGTSAVGRHAHVAMTIT